MDCDSSFFSLLSTTPDTPLIYDRGEALRSKKSLPTGTFDENMKIGPIPLSFLDHSKLNALLEYSKNKKLYDHLKQAAELARQASIHADRGYTCALYANVRQETDDGPATYSFRKEVSPPHPVFSSQIKAHAYLDSVIFKTKGLKRSTLAITIERLGVNTPLDAVCTSLTFYIRLIYEMLELKEYHAYNDIAFVTEISSSKYEVLATLD